MMKENMALKAQIWRPEEERDIPKKLRRTLPGNSGEVCLHQEAHPRVPHLYAVPGAEDPPQRLLWLA